MAKHTKKSPNFRVLMIYVPTLDEWVIDHRRSYAVSGRIWHFSYGTNPNKTGILTRKATAEQMAQDVSDTLNASVELYEWNLLKPDMPSITTFHPDVIAGA